MESCRICFNQLKIYELTSHYFEIGPHKPGLSLWLNQQLARCNVHWRSFNSRLNFTSNMAENIDKNHCTCGGLVWDERTQITSSVQYKTVQTDTLYIFRVIIWKQPAQMKLRMMQVTDDTDDLYPEKSFQSKVLIFDERDEFLKF